MRPRPSGVKRARAEDKPRPDRDPEPVRSRRQGHGDSLAVCVMRLAPATMSEMAIAMTTRITRRFEALRRAGELGLVAYITAGDPTLDATERIVPALADAGADVVELGAPFSDPLADGPTIQRARGPALRGGTTLAGMRGPGKDTAQPPAGPLAVTSLPVAVGLGISLPGHVSILGGLADAAVVGSALVAEIEKAPSVDAAVAAVAERVRLLKQAATRGISRREARP